MATKARYTVIHGEVISEKRGANHRTYVPDANCNTVALVDNGGTVTDTFTYWPYGEVKSRVGNTSTPFRFAGTLGYHFDVDARVYVRSRFYAPRLGRWNSIDAMWPYVGHAFSYVVNSPVTATDPSGYYTKAKNACGIAGVFKITPDSNDWAGVSSGIGRDPAVISGKDAIIRTRQRGDCIAINGGYYYPTWPSTGERVYPVGGVVDCWVGTGGPPSTTFDRGPSKKPRFIDIIPIITRHGYTHGRPIPPETDSGGPANRTAACLNKDGSIRFIIAAPQGKISFRKLKDCVTKDCKDGIFVHLDSGGSAQTTERLAGNYSDLGGPRLIHNWIVICD